MTHQEPARGHVDLETLAELAEGLLGRSSAASTRAHLASCSECQQRAENLAGVSRLLATAAPTVMPDEVATRIDAALEAAADEAGIPEGLPSDHVGPDRVVRRSLRRSRRLQVSLGAAAAALVLVVGGLAGTRALLEDRNEITSASQPDGARQNGAGAGEPGAVAPETSVAQGPPVVATGTNYSAAALREQTSQLMRQRMAQGSATAEATPDALRPLADAGRLNDCIAAAVTDDPARQPLVIDLARYEGDPAAVVVLPADDQQGLDVWVLGRSCAADQPDVLHHTLLPR